MTRTYLVTAKNLVDTIEVEVAAKSKKEALSVARDRIRRKEHLSRYDGKVTWSVAEVGASAPATHGQDLR